MPWNCWPALGRHGCHRFGRAPARVPGCAAMDGVGPGGRGVRPGVKRMCVCSHTLVSNNANTPMRAH
eukprot:5423476-Lingulodinium_polyedra.AAC.1